MIIHSRNGRVNNTAPGTVQKACLLQKVNGSPIYDSVRWECLLERTLIPSRCYSEVGWPIPFLAICNFPSVATGCPHLLVDGQRASILTMTRGFSSSHRCSAQQPSALTTVLLAQRLLRTAKTIHYILYV